MKGHKWTLVPRIFAPQARIRREWRNCSGSVPYLKPVDSTRPTPPAAEQMVRSSRDAPRRWKKTAVHAGALQEAHRAAIAVRQNSFGSGFGGDGLEAPGDFIERIIPGDAREAALTFDAYAPQRVEEPLGRIFAFQVAGDFAAH